MAKWSSKILVFERVLIVEKKAPKVAPHSNVTTKAHRLDSGLNDEQNNYVKDGFRRLFTVDGQEGIFVYTRAPKKDEESVSGAVIARFDETVGVFTRAKDVEKVLAKAMPSA